MLEEGVTMKRGKLFLRKLCLLAVDITAVISSGLIVSGLYWWQEPGVHYPTWLGNMVLLAAIYLGGLLLGRVYDTLWRYAGTTEFLYCIVITLCLGAVYTVASIIISDFLPTVLYILIALLITVAVLFVRLVYRYLRFLQMQMEQRGKQITQKRTMLVGAGASADLLLRDMRLNPQNCYQPVCVVDDDPAKTGRFFHGMPVAGNIDKIQALCEKKQIETILICTPSATEGQKKRIYEKCMETKCKTYLIPDMTALIQDEKPLMQKMREINIEDLLGRKSIALDNKAAKETFSQKVVLVTGAGGSIGSELVRQLAKLQPAKLILLDIYENSVYTIQQELKFLYGDNFPMVTEIASIRDRKKIEQLFQKYHPQIIFHAAAHKHVPLMEANPEEAVKNNIFGTKNVAELAVKYGVERFLLISTDKAVNPTNVMGATKRFTEMLIQMLNKQGKTRFVAVRFGNVIGSNGSVIPLFKQQLEKGGPLTVTHKDIIRYFMTIPEAVQLVLEAGSMAKGGEIFILDMGKPVKILDVAEKMIRLSGLEPYQDIDIKFVGLRPGEKLYEELRMSEEGALRTQNSKIFIANITAASDEKLEQSLKMLRQALEMQKEEQLIEALRYAVPTYHPQMEYHQAAEVAAVSESAEKDTKVLEQRGAVIA